MSGDNLVQLAYASADEKVRPTPRTLGVTTSDEIEAIFREGRRGEARGALRQLRRVLERAPRHGARRSTQLDRERAHEHRRCAASHELPDARSTPSRPTLRPARTPAHRLLAGTGPARGASKSSAPLFAGLAVAALALGAGGWFALQRADGTGRRSVVLGSERARAPAARRGPSHRQVLRRPRRPCNALPA